MIVRLLYDLQQVDTALEALQRSLSALEARLQDTSALEGPSQRVEEARRRERLLRGRQRELELTLGGLEEKARALEGRLFSGRVTNPKELLGIQEEIRLLRTRIGQTEEALLQVMEEVEQAERDLQGAQEAYAAAQAQWSAQRQQWEGQYQRVLQEKAALEERRALLLRSIDPATLNLYTTLRASKNGIAVARVERGVCRPCGVAVPQGLLVQARGGKEVVRCPTCGRLLYVE
jgi:predicted  nucleic acid-binding Zn-ribbon protein